MNRVLIVDDKEANIAYLQALLARDDCTVDSARHGAEALVKARLNPPDLVIGDLLMPVMDGYTLLRHWKADPLLNNVPFIVFTATYTAIEDQELALNLGAAAFILKPAEQKQLLARLHEVLANAANTEPVPPRISLDDENTQLKLYSETLIRKLEEKTLRLEQTNRVLEHDIIERKRTEESLRESEERFSGAFEHAPIGLALVSPDGRFLKVNQSLCNFVDYSKVELLARTFQDITHPDDLETDLDFVRQMISGEINSYQMEKRYVRKLGDLVTVLINVSLVRDGKGQPLYFISQIQDFTERKLAEALLTQSEQRLELATQSANIGIWDWDVVANKMIWDKQTFALYGISEQEFSGAFDAWQRGLHPDDRERAEADLTAAIEGRGDFHNEFRVVCPNGAVRHIEAHGLVQRAGNGSPTRMIGVNWDITDRKEVELAAARLAAIVASSGDAIIGSDLDNVVTSWNKGAEKIFGHTASEMIGRSMLALLPADRQEEESYLLGKIKLGENVEHFETVRIAKHDRLIDVAITASPVRDNKGIITGASKVARDITAHKQAEATRALLEAQLRESQKLEAIGTLAGGIAHDFNNIIAAILGNVELALADITANPEAQESLEEIRLAGRRARDMVQQILSFSRRQPTERKPISLAPVVHESVRLLRVTLPARLSLNTHCEADVPQVLADATQIQQVLVNLSTNAMHAMKGRPGRLEMVLDTVMLDTALAAQHPAVLALHDQHPGRTVRLTVRDNGVGMDQATLGRMFEPFFTTKPAGEGTGLGLSVVLGIVQTHEGAMVVDSAPGKGTKFTLYLPVAERQADAPAADESAAASVPTRRGGEHILYLDDDEALVFLVERLLRRRGYRVSGYTNQREALAALGAEPASFDLVVTDYNMPGMSGLDVAREVRLIRPDLPVAVASGFIDETLQEHADAAGVRELIFKATEVNEMVAAFARLAQTDAADRVAE